MYHPALPDDTRRAAILPVDFTAEDFARRRANIFEHIGSATAVIFGGLTPPGSTAFRQTNDFYYLCGIEAPHAILRLDGKRGLTTLYLPPRDETHERWDGPSLSAQDVDLLMVASGVDAVREPAALLSDLQGSDTIWTPFAEAEGACMYQDTLRAARRLIDADPWSAQPSLESFRQNLLRDRTGAAIKDLSPRLAELRMFKDIRELQVMQRAGALCASATVAAMMHTAPGVYEYELAAVAEHVYRAGGARGNAYRAIVPGGANIWHTHYFRNDCPLRDGDLVLFDCAPDLNYYTSDIGRYWPVNGRYTDRQRPSLQPGGDLPQGFDRRNGPRAHTTRNP